MTKRNFLCHENAKPNFPELAAVENSNDNRHNDQSYSAGPSPWDDVLKHSYRQVPRGPGIQHHNRPPVSPVLANPGAVSNPSQGPVFVPHVNNPAGSPFRVHQRIQTRPAASSRAVPGHLPSQNAPSRTNSRGPLQRDASNLAGDGSKHGLARNNSAAASPAADVAAAVVKRRKISEDVNLSNEDAASRDQQPSQIRSTGSKGTAAAVPSSSRQPVGQGIARPNSRTVSRDADGRAAVRAGAKPQVQNQIAAAVPERSIEDREREIREKREKMEREKQEEDRQRRLKMQEFEREKEVMLQERLAKELAVREEDQRRKNKIRNARSKIDTGNSEWRDFVTSNLITNAGRRTPVSNARSPIRQPSPPNVPAIIPEQPATDIQAEAAPRDFGDDIGASYGDVDSRQPEDDLRAMNGNLTFQNPGSSVDEGEAQFRSHAESDYAAQEALQQPVIADVFMSPVSDIPPPSPLSGNFREEPVPAVKQEPVLSNSFPVEAPVHGQAKAEASQSRQVLPNTMSSDHHMMHIAPESEFRREAAGSRPDSIKRSPMEEQRNILHDKSFNKSKAFFPTPAGQKEAGNNSTSNSITPLALLTQKIKSSEQVVGPLLKTGPLEKNWLKNVLSNVATDPRTDDEGDEPMAQRDDGQPSAVESAGSAQVSATPQGGRTVSFSPLAEVAFPGTTLKDLTIHASSTIREKELPRSLAAITPVSIDIPVDGQVQEPQPMEDEPRSHVDDMLRAAREAHENGPVMNGREKSSSPSRAQRQSRSQGRDISPSRGREREPLNSPDPRRQMADIQQLKRQMEQAAIPEIYDDSMGRGAGNGFGGDANPYGSGPPSSSQVQGTVPSRNSRNILGSLLDKIGGVAGSAEAGNVNGLNLGNADDPFSADYNPYLKPDSFGARNPQNRLRPLDGIGSAPGTDQYAPEQDLDYLPRPGTHHTLAGEAESEARAAESVHHFEAMRIRANSEAKLRVMEDKMTRISLSGAPPLPPCRSPARSRSRSKSNSPSKRKPIVPDANDFVPVSHSPAVEKKNSDLLPPVTDATVGSRPILPKMQTVRESESGAGPDTEMPQSSRPEMNRPRYEAQHSLSLADEMPVGGMSTYSNPEDMQMEGGIWVPTVTDMQRVECPHCHRKFAEAAAQRHIPKCQKIKAKPKQLLPKSRNLVTDSLGRRVQAENVQDSSKSALNGPGPGFGAAVQKAKLKQEIPLASPFGPTFDSQWEQVQMLLRRGPTALSTESRIADLHRVAKSGLKFLRDLEQHAPKLGKSKGELAKLLTAGSAQAAKLRLADEVRRPLVVCAKELKDSIKVSVRDDSDLDLLKQGLTLILAFFKNLDGLCAHEKLSKYDLVSQKLRWTTLNRGG